MTIDYSHRPPLDPSDLERLSSFSSAAPSTHATEPFSEPAAPPVPEPEPETQLEPPPPPRPVVTAIQIASAETKRKFKGYVKLEFPAAGALEPKHLTSETIKKKVEKPTWDESFPLTVREDDSIEFIVMRIHALWKDTPEGTGRVPGRSLQNQDRYEVPLTNKKGQPAGSLHLRITQTLVQDESPLSRPGAPRSAGPHRGSGTTAASRSDRRGPTNEGAALRHSRP